MSPLNKLSAQIRYSREVKRWRIRFSLRQWKTLTCLPYQIFWLEDFLLIEWSHWNLLRFPHINNLHIRFWQPCQFHSFSWFLHLSLLFLLFSILERALQDRRHISKTTRSFCTSLPISPPRGIDTSVFFTLPCSSVSDPICLHTYPCVNLRLFLGF